jgi:hypothetical protein
MSALGGKLVADVERHDVTIQEIFDRLALLEGTIRDLSEYGVVPIVRGGSGAKTPEGARIAFELGSAAVRDVGAASTQVAEGFPTGNREALLLFTVSPGGAPLFNGQAWPSTYSGGDMSKATYDPDADGIIEIAQGGSGRSNGLAGLTNMGAKAGAFMEVGTTAGTLAEGDHLHTGIYALLAHNHAGIYAPAIHQHTSTEISDSGAFGRQWLALALIADGITLLGLKDAAFREVGTTIGKVAAGDDARFHTHANLNTLNDITDVGGAPYYKGSPWPGTGTAGDMLKSSYATISSTIVDRAYAANSVAWDDVSGRPTLATVATTGAYNDLSGKPDLSSLHTHANLATLNAIPAFTGGTAKYLREDGTFQNPPTGGTGGDMYKVTYDSVGDGVVNAARAVSGYDLSLLHSHANAATLNKLSEISSTLAIDSHLLLRADGTVPMTGELQVDLSASAFKEGLAVQHSVGNVLHIGHYPTSTAFRQTSVAGFSFSNSNANYWLVDPFGTLLVGNIPWARVQSPPALFPPASHSITSHTGIDFTLPVLAADIGKVLRIGTTGGGQGDKIVIGALTYADVGAAPLVHSHAGYASASHASQHKQGSTDTIKIDELGAASDNTLLNVSISAHGLCPKLSNRAYEYLNGVGGFSIPLSLGSGANEASPGNHNHDARYALTTHNHTGTYAPVIHYHDASHITTGVMAPDKLGAGAGTPDGTRVLCNDNQWRTAQVGIGLSGTFTVYQGVDEGTSISYWKKLTVVGGRITAQQTYSAPWGSPTPTGADDYIPGTLA